MARPRRTYTKAFKIEAVRLVTDGGRRVTAVAREFKHTADADHAQPVAPNRLAQIGPITQRDAAYATDATYIWTRQGWLYLTAVMDQCTRRIVG